VAQADELVRSDATAAQATRATSRGFYHFQALAPSVCQVTYVVQADLGGSIPKAVMASRVKRTLGSVQEMQAKFERKGKAVDAEMRSAFPLPPPLAELNDEQKLVVESCRYLESEEGGEWEPLPSSSPFVDMWCKHAPTKGGERSVAIGKATTVIDFPVRDAAQFMFSYTSRERMRISREEGNPARLRQKVHSAHDQVFATIKKMPFPLNDREFVARQVCATDTNGDLLFSAVPVDDVIDYGLKHRTVRGVARTLMRFTPSGESQCKVTFIQYLDAGGVIPVRVFESKIPLALSGVGEMRDELQRDDEIDKMEREEFARVMKDEQQVYSEDEDSLIQRVQDKLGALKEEDFEELESPDHLVKMGKIFIDGDRRVVIRASVTIDSAVEECAALDFLKMSRASLKRRSGESSFVKENDHSGVFYFCKDFHIPGGKLRDGVQRLVFKWMSASTLEIHSGRVDHGQFPIRDGVVRTTNAVVYKYERFEPVGGVPQTRVTFSQQADMGGLLPTFVVNQQAPKQLVHLSKMRKQFDKSLEIDGAARAQNVGLIADHMEQYSEEETALLEEGEKHFADFKEMKVKSMTMTSPLTTGEIAFKKKDSQTWGRATTTVRARPEEVLAFMWDMMRRLARREDDLEKSVEEQVNGHNQLVYNKKRSPKIVADRDFLARFLWKKEGDGFVYVTSPEESYARPMTDGVVRGKYPSAMRIKGKNDRETTLEYVIHPDAGGSLPSWLASRYLGSNLSYVTEIQEYFQALRGLEEWDADDARAAGEVMCIKTKAEKHPEKGENKQSARMRELFKKHQALGEIGRKYEFFEGMMARVVRITLKPAGDVKSKLCSVSLKEGETIGRGLAMALASNLTAEAAVDEWILKYKRSLGELDRTEAWFR